LPIGKIVEKKIRSGAATKVVKLLTFVACYLMISFLIVPLLAKPFGRVTLPVTTTTLRPLSWWTCLLNRHYVQPTLKQTAEKIAIRLNKDFPATQVAYMDANFPFFDGFPLFPHLSHNDGKKLDLAFFYQSAASGEQLNGIAPSFIGYGVYEHPLPGETNMPLTCSNRGYWQYSFMEHLIPQENKTKMRLDTKRTRKLLTLLAAEPAVSKVLLNHI
jgi:hypothetical protein